MGQAGRVGASRQGWGRQAGLGQAGRVRAGRQAGRVRDEVWQSVD